MVNQHEVRILPVLSTFEAILADGWSVGKDRLVPEMRVAGGCSVDSRSSVTMTMGNENRM